MPGNRQSLLTNQRGDRKASRRLTDSVCTPQKRDTNLALPVTSERVSAVGTKFDKAGSPGVPPKTIGNRLPEERDKRKHYQSFLHGLDMGDVRQFAKNMVDSFQSSCCELVSCSEAPRPLMESP